MPREANPNSKYSLRKAKEAEKRRIETEALEAERRRIAEKEAELEQKARELEEKQAETLRIKAETEAKPEQNGVETNSETVSQPNETGNETMDFGDDLFAELNEVLSETKEPTDQNIIENAADAPDMFDDSLGDAEFPDIDIPMDDADDAEQIEMGLPADETAEMLVEGLQAIQVFVLPALYEREFFTPQERSKIRLIIQKAGKNGKKEIELDDEDLILLNKANDYEEYRDKLPFTASEKKMLLKPLTKLFAQKGVAMSPTTAFIIALVVVSLPRWTPIAAKKFDNWQQRKKQQNTDND